MADEIGIVFKGNATQLVAESQRAGSALDKFGKDSARSVDALSSVVNGLTGKSKDLAQSFAQLNANAGRDAFSNLASGLGATSAAISKTNTSIADANQRLGFMRPSLDSAADGVNRLTSSFSSLSALGGQLGTALTVGFAVGKIFEFRDAMLDAQVNIDKLRNSITYGLGAYSVAQEISYLRKASNDMGLEFSTTSQLYAKFAAAARGTALEGKGTKDVFEAVGKASTVMGLGVGEVQGVMLALTQILSKGTVQSEEIRGQLGERLPGAFAIAARSMGVTTAEFGKLLETGQVVSTDFLPKFAAQMEKEFAGSFEKASQSVQSSLNRMSNSWTDLKTVFADDMGIAKWFASSNDRVADGFAGATEAMRRVKAETGSTFQAFNAGLTSLYMNTGSYATQVKGLEDQLKPVQQELARLMQIQASPGFDSPWLRISIEQTQAYIKTLEDARDKVTALRDAGQPDKGPGNVSAIAANYPTRSQSASTEEARIAKIRSGVEAVQLGLSNVSANFQKHLSALYAGYNAGIISQAKYVADVTELIKQEGTAHKTGADHLKTIHDAKYALTKAAEEQVTAVMSVEIAKQARLNELSFKGGSTDAEAYYARRAALELQAIDRKEAMLQQELKSAQAAAVGLKKEEDKLRAQERIVKVTTQLIELGKERIKIDGPDDAAVRAWEKMNAVTANFDAQVAQVNSGLYNQQKALTEGLDEAKIKLQYQWDANGALKEEIALVQLRYERGRKLLEQKLMESSLSDDEKDKLRATLSEDATAKAAQAYANDVKGSLTSIEGTARAVWTNVTQGGQDSASKVGNTLKAAVADALWQITAKKWILNVGAYLSSVGGGSSSGASVGANGTPSLGGVSLGGNNWFSNFSGSAGNTVSDFGTTLVDKGYTTMGSQLESWGLSMNANSSALNNVADGMSYLGAAMSASKGQWGAAIGSAIGTYFGGPIGSAIGSTIGSFVDQMAKGGETRAGASYAVNTADGSVYKTQGPSGGEIAAENIRTSIASAYSGINTMLQKLGSTDHVTAYYAGEESSKNGKAFAGSGGTLASGSDFGETGRHAVRYVGDMDASEAAAALLVDMKRSALEVYQVATGIPKSLHDALAGMDIEALTESQVSTLHSQIEQVVNLQAALEALPFENLKNLAFDATRNLIAQSGGLDALGQRLSNTYDKFYTGTEKTANLTNATSTAFEKLGITMPAIDGASRAWYRSQLDVLTAQDLGIESNARSLAGFLALGDSLDQLATQAEATAKAQQEWQDRADIASGASTARQQQLLKDLASTTDQATRALIRQAYAQEDAKALAEQQATWQDRIAIATGSSTARQQQLQKDLTAATDDATRALIRQAYAEEDKATLATWADKLAVLTGQTTAREIELRKDLNSTTDEATKAIIRQVSAEQQRQDDIKQALGSFDASALSKMIFDAAFDPAAGMTAAQSFAQSLTRSVQDALLGSTLGQVSKAIFDSVVIPVAAGGAVSMATMDAVFADAKNKLDALSQLFNDPAFIKFMGALADGISKTIVPAVASFSPTSAYDSVAEKRASERQSLQDQLDKLTKSSSQLREIERSKIDAANRSLFDSVKAREDQLAREDLKNKLDVLQGKTSDRALQLQKDLASTSDAAAQSLMRQIYAQEQLATKVDWQNQLNELIGKPADRSLKLQADLASTTDEATKAIIRQVYAQQDLKAVLDVSKSATDAAFAALQRSVAAEKTSWQTAQQVAQDAISATTAVFDTLKAQVSDLYGEVASTTGMLANQGQMFIDRALAAAQSTGYLPDEKDLADAIAGVRKGIDAGNFASQFQADQARLQLAGKLDALKNVTGNQLTAEQRQLKAAEDALAKLEKIVSDGQAMIDATRGVDTSVTSVAAAIDRLAKALLKEQVDTSAAAANAGGGSSTMSATQLAAMQTDLLKRNATDFANINFKGGITDALQAKLQSGSTYPNIFVTATSALQALQGAGTDALTSSGRAMQGLLDPNANISATDRYAINHGEMTSDQFIAKYGLDGGTNRVPQDMYAYIHKDEAVVPAKFNPALFGPPLFQQFMQPAAGRDQVLQLLVAEIRGQREDQRAQMQAMVKMQARVAKMVEAWDVDGMPAERAET